MIISYRNEFLWRDVTPLDHCSCWPSRWQAHSKTSAISRHALSASCPGRLAFCIMLVSLGTWNLPPQPQPAYPTRHHTCTVHPRSSILPVIPSLLAPGCGFVRLETQNLSCNLKYGIQWHLLFQSIACMSPNGSKWVQMAQIASVHHIYQHWMLNAEPRMSIPYNGQAAILPPLLQFAAPKF